MIIFFNLLMVSTERQTAMETMDRFVTQLAQAKQDRAKFQAMEDRVNAKHNKLSTIEQAWMTAFEDVWNNRIITEAPTDIHKAETAFADACSRYDRVAANLKSLKTQLEKDSKSEPLLLAHIVGLDDVNPRRVPSEIMKDLIKMASDMSHLSCDGAIDLVSELLKSFSYYERFPDEDPRSKTIGAAQYKANAGTNRIQVELALEKLEMVVKYGVTGVQLQAMLAPILPKATAERIERDTKWLKDVMGSGNGFAAAAGITLYPTGATPLTKEQTKGVAVFNGTIGDAISAITGKPPANDPRGTSLTTPTNGTDPVIIKQGQKTITDDAGRTNGAKVQARIVTSKTDNARGATAAGGVGAKAKAGASTKRAAEAAPKGEGKKKRNKKKQADPEGFVKGLFNEPAYKNWPDHINQTWCRWHHWANHPTHKCQMPWSRRAKYVCDSQNPPNCTEEEFPAIRAKYLPKG